MPDPQSATHDAGLDAEDLRDAVSLHLARHIGEAQPAFIDGDAWADRAKEPGPPVDVLVCPPEGERRFAYVASCGCALKPLPGVDALGEANPARRVEFVLAAPQRGEEGPDREILNLAANTVRQFAKLVHLQPVTVAPGHTVAFSTDPQPVFDGTNQVAFAFMLPRLPSEGFHTLNLGDGDSIRFFAPTGIDRAELDAAIEKGVDALSIALVRAGVTEMLDFERASVAQTDPALRPGWLTRIRRLFSRRSKDR